MDSRPQRISLERVRRLTGDGLPTSGALSVPLTPDEVRAWRRHAEGSTLYGHLMGLIASDDELMRVLNEIEHTPRPNVLLAGIQYLLIRDPAQPLASHYPT